MIGSFWQRAGRRGGTCRKGTRTAWALLLLVSLWGPSLVAAAEPPRPAADPVEAELDTAPVEIDDQVLFRVRGTSSFPAQQRAAGIRKRIKSVASDRLFPSALLRIEETDNGSMIMAGDKPVLMVTEWDARLEHVSRQYVARSHLERIRQAIDGYRRSRSSDALLESGMFAVVATAVLCLVVALLVPFGRWLDRLLSQALNRRITTAGIQSFQVVRAENVYKVVHKALYVLRLAVVALLLLGYLHVVLSLFPWTRGTFRRLVGLDSEALARMGKAVLGWIPDLLVLIVLFFLFRFVLRLLRHFFDAVGNRRITLPNFDAEWAVPTYKTARFALLAFGVVIAYPYLPGSESAAFKGVTVFIGLVFSLGSSAAVSNIIAGYLIFYRRVFRVGDRVKVGEVVGDVLAIRLQMTHLLSLKNEEVTIPNSQILSGNVVNYSILAQQQGLILHTEVGIGYETPWRQVEAMLLLAAERTPRMLREPPPFVLVKRLGDFSVVYELNVYREDPTTMLFDYSELHRNILDVFNQYGVQVMTPAYIADPAQPKLVPREQWYAEPAAPPGEQRSKMRDGGAGGGDEISTSG